jgi:hypothetical protein
MVTGDSYGIALLWNEVANATGYRVYRGIAPISSAGGAVGVSGQVVSVLDLTQASSAAPGTERLIIDAMVYPGTTYVYWVDAVFADGTASPPSVTSTVSASRTEGTGSAWVPNLRAVVAGTSSILVTGLMAGTPLSVRGGSATMPGSSLTWTWDPALAVFGYEIEWSVVENGVTLVFGRDRVTPDWSGYPDAPMTLSPVTKGIPAGKTVRFCVAFYSDPDRTKPLDPNSGPCVTSTAPAAATTSNFVQGAPMATRGTVTVMSSGPPPSSVVVQGIGPKADIIWTPPSVPSPATFVYSVNRAVAGTTSWTLLTPSPISATTLSGDVLPNITTTYTYQVRATAADGTFGTASFDYQPPAPIDPVQFTALQIGDGSVDLSWTPVGGVSKYLISGPGLGNGLTVSGTAGLTRRSHVVMGVPIGTHTWTITSVYEPGGVLTQPTAWPRASATVTRLSGRYRVTLLGFEVNRATLYDLITDGGGDEVYLAAFVSSQNQATGVSGAQGAPKSVVYGNVAGWSQREMAGTLSPQGGLKTGDSYPLSGGGSWPVVVPQRDRLPMLLWEGALSAGADVLLIQPAIWESDVDGGGSSAPFAQWVTDMTGSVPSLYRDPAVAAETKASGLRWIPGPSLQLRLLGQVDHPIGVTYLMPGYGTYVQPVVVLTQEKVESVLSAPQTIGGLAPGIVTVPVRDAFQDDYNGAYTMYLRVERIP